MANDTITIQEAADLSKKSVQTIRRAIKSKKLKTKKQKTPQGFNYLVDKASLFEIYNMGSVEKAAEAPKVKEKKTVEAQESQEIKSHKKESTPVTSEDLQRFTMMLEKMMSQHSEERQNFLRLVNTLQEKIFVLDNQLSLLRAPEKKWYSFWK